MSFEAGMEAFCVASLMIFGKPLHDVIVQFQIHVFPYGVSVEFVIFLGKNVGCHSFGFDFVYEFAIVKACIKPQAVSYNLIDKFVHGMKLLFSKIKSLDDFP